MHLEVNPIRGCGVYVIRHTSGHFYIGSTGEFSKRRGEHLALLRHGNHPVKMLQDLFEAEEDYIWEYHPTLRRADANELEKRMISACIGNPFMTNKKGTDWVRVMAPDVVEKIASWKRGRALTQEHRDRIAKGLTGHKRSIESIAKSSAKRRIAVIVDGVVYESYLDAAKTHGICSNTAINRTKSNSARFASWQLVTDKGDSNGISC